MFTIADIVSFVKPVAYFTPFPQKWISAFIFDSRRVITEKRVLFFAIKSEKNDGHNYIKELIKRGVRNFIITESIQQFQEYKQCNFIQVTNPIAAMQQIAKRHREKFDIPVIGITGSNGKTIVKEWLSFLLYDDFHIVKNPNSYNSQLGVPISVSQMSPAHQLAIFEAGISQPNEMKKLAEIIQPTIGIITNIGTAHSQFFKNNKQKLREKLKLFEKSSKLIYCSDYKEIDNELAKPSYQQLEKISWGYAPSACYTITHFEKKEYYTNIALNEQFLEIPFTDNASIENAIHVIVTLHTLGYSFTNINKKIALLTAMNMRMELKQATNHSILIDDTYSLDINSLKIAIDFLNSQKHYHKKSIILSDFRQTAPLTEKNYKEISQLLVQNKIHRLIAVGKEFKRYKHCFTPFADSFSTFFYDSTEDLLEDISKFAFNNEAILIKGARSFRFEQISQYIQSKTHQTVLNVNLSSIIHNLNYYRSLLRPSVKIVAMVKSFSYGLGNAELINELQYHNIDYLAVAYGDEGVKLRQQLIKTPIIVLGAEAHSFELLIRYQLEPAIFNFHYLSQLETTLQNYPEITDFKVHIKLDTGIHRLGFDENDISEICERLNKHPQIKIASIFSHLAAAEDPSEDCFTKEQIRQFDEMSSRLISHFEYPILRHILNSAGISRFPEAQFDMVRLGIGLYGFSFVPSVQPHLLHSVTLKTIITQIKTIKKGETVSYNRTYTAPKEMRIGVIPIGYADGLFRELSNGVGKVIINGQPAPIIGKICMDMCMIDLSKIKNVHIGDEVIVYGEENRIDTIAANIKRTPYELLTAISRRVPRIYIME